MADPGVACRRGVDRLLKPVPPWVLQCDAYSAYDSFVRKRPACTITLAIVGKQWVPSNHRQEPYFVLRYAPP